MSPASDETDPIVARQAMLVNMRRIVRSVQELLVGNAARVGMNQSDFLALVHLVYSGGVTGAKLGRTLGMTSSSITEMADRLENAGLIERTRSPADRRLVVLAPTARGRKDVERALGPASQEMLSLLEDLSDKDLPVVRRFLDDVSRRLLELSRPAA